MRKAALLFGEGTDRSAKVLGGKGAGLAEMSALGIPVPPGFTVPTGIARAFQEHGRLPQRTMFHLKRGIATIERQTGRKFGDARNPLLVSVRSGAAVSMPGMMDTVLNLGLNPEIVEGLVRVYGSKEFARESYQRFLAMFRKIVNQPVVPDDPWQQLELAIEAVFKSWNNDRARLYRKVHGIPDWWGTAVTVQAMVFGNRGNDSGTGVVFSRNVATGEPGLYGEFLVNAQGEEIVTGTRTPMPIVEMKNWNSTLYTELEQLVRKLEAHHKDVVDVEFTIERGKLYILQVRVAKRTPEAALTIATHFVWEKRWSKEEALAKISRGQVSMAQSPRFDPATLERVMKTRLLAKGLAASPGAVSGSVARSSSEAEYLARLGYKVILVRDDTSPDDLAGMLAASAIVTRTGGSTSHAAVVARGLGKPAVVGVSYIDVFDGQEISVDGNTGVVINGALPLIQSVSKKEVNIFTRWMRKGQMSSAPRLDFERLGELRNIRAERLINDFYLTEAMEIAAVGTSLAKEAAELKQSVHTATAELIATYLAIAVAGELGHAGSKIDLRVQDTIRHELDELRYVYRIEFGDGSSKQRNAIERLTSASVEEQIKFFALAERVFSVEWNSQSFGGKKWAAIADAGKKFLTGELNHSVFADHAFDLQHNTGTVFGKDGDLPVNGYSIKNQLDGKKHAVGIQNFYRVLKDSYSSFSPEVTLLWQKGVEIGIWR